MEINGFYGVFFQPEKCGFLLMSFLGKVEDVFPFPQLLICHSQPILGGNWPFFQGQDVEETCRV